MNIEALVTNFEKEFEGKKYLYLPDPSSKSLIVAMSTHNFGDKYYMLRGLAEQKQCSLLFIKDPKNTYYLEKDSGASYQRLLKHFIEIYGSENITLFGSSMSGYGALYHSLSLGLNAIVSNPQTNFKASFDHAWPDLKKTLLAVRESFINLDEKIVSMDKVDCQWFYAFGNNSLDLKNLTKVRSLNKEGLRICYENIKDNDHGFYFKNKENVYKLHFVLMNMRKIKLTK